jgi:hypothetical protein
MGRVAQKESDSKRGLEETEVMDQRDLAGWWIRLEVLSSAGCWIMLWRVASQVLYVQERET